MSGNNMEEAYEHWEILCLTKHAISQGIIPLAEVKCRRLFRLTEEQITWLKQGKGHGVDFVVCDNEKQEKLQLILRAEKGKFWLAGAKEFIKRKGFKVGMPFKLGFDGNECDKQFDGCVEYPQQHQHFKIIFD